MVLRLRPVISLQNTVIRTPQFSGHVRLGGYVLITGHAKGNTDMRFQKVIIPAVLATALASTSAAYAWTSDGHGNIRCGDGSSAKAIQKDDGNWTVVKAGDHGSSGGSFGTEGQAALYACGEGG